MPQIASIGLALLIAFISYVVGGFGGGILVSWLSQNRHDKSVVAALVTEVVMSMMFLLVIMGATERGRPRGWPRWPSACAWR